MNYWELLFKRQLGKLIPSLKSLGKKQAKISNAFLLEFSVGSCRRLYHSHHPWSLGPADFPLYTILTVINYKKALEAVYANDLQCFFIWQDQFQISRYHNDCSRFAIKSNLVLKHPLKNLIDIPQVVMVIKSIFNIRFRQDTSNLFIRF